MVSESDKKKKYFAEMAKSEEKAKEFLKRSLYKQDVSNDQIICAFEYFGAIMKLKIENEFYLSQEEKDLKIQRIEKIVYDLRVLLDN